MSNRTAKRKGGFRGKLRMLIPLGVIVGLALQYSRLDEPKKIYIRSIVTQIPSLPGRYYV